MMFITPLIRLGVLGTTTFFSLIVLGISAHLISQPQQYFAPTATFNSLAIAVSVITLVTLPAMIVVDILRNGAFTSMIVVEVVWLSILWVLWVAAAGESVTGYALYFPAGCGYASTIYNVNVNGLCQETQAVQAFSFLNFIIIALYTGFIAVLAMIAISRGQNVWLSSVRESFGGSATGPMEHPMAQYPPAEPAVNKV